ncbi:MAG: hypothetical protein PHN90_10585 [Methanothrix sp.]|nr:hypothetical protein [Methanothrix sp.]
MVLAIGGGESWGRRALLGGGGFPIEGRACGQLVVAMGAVGDRRAISAPILSRADFREGAGEGSRPGGRESPG